MLDLVYYLKRRGLLKIYQFKPLIHFEIYLGDSPSGGDKGLPFVSLGIITVLAGGYFYKLRHSPPLLQVIRFGKPLT